MLCDNCNQNEATIHYTEVINGVKNERHLCSECMRELDYGVDGEFPFSKLIKNILASHFAGVGAGNSPQLKIQCNKCGMTYDEFTHVGKFGCSECYSVFGPLIVDNIKKIQGSGLHTGKKYVSSLENSITQPSLREVKVSDKDMIIRLDEKLKDALLIEDYEEAAKLRDEIKALKERVGRDA